MEGIKRYVVGFLFDGGLEKVVLIEKLKPENIYSIFYY